MNKSTPFYSDPSSEKSSTEEKKLANGPKKETINNIMAFAKSYSVRKGKSLDKMEFMLN